MSNVHDRYHLILVLDGGERDMRETVRSRGEAFDRANALVRLPDVASVEIFDTMARRGSGELWRLLRPRFPDEYTHTAPPVQIRGGAG